MKQEQDTSSPTRALPVPEPKEVSKLFVRKNVSKRGLAAFTEAALAKYAPHLIPELLQALHQGVRDGDRVLIKLGAEMYGLAGKGAGIVINNINSASASAEAKSDSAVYEASFDAIVRKAAERKQQAARQAVVDVVATA